MDSAQWGKTVQLFCYFGSSLATFWKTATDEKKFSIYEQIQTFQSRWEKHNNYITFVEEGIVETALIPLKIQINHSGKTFILLDSPPTKLLDYIFEFQLKSVKSELDIVVSI